MEDPYPMLKYLKKSSVTDPGTWEAGERNQMLVAVVCWCVYSHCASWHHINIVIVETIPINFAWQRHHIPANTTKYTTEIADMMQSHARRTQHTRFRTSPALLAFTATSVPIANSFRPDSMREHTCILCMRIISTSDVHGDQFLAPSVFQRQRTWHFRMQKKPHT